MDKALSESLDKYITGNYGEDQLTEGNCEICGEIFDDAGPHEMDDMYVCTACFSHAVDQAEYAKGDR
jgi:formylmethanofuran dehydrogenase subunit E